MADTQPAANEDRPPRLIAITTLATGWQVTLDGALHSALTPRNRLLVFLDILGWRRHIEDGDYAACQSFLAMIHPFLSGYETYNATHEADIQVSMMSDTLLLSVPTPPTPERRSDLKFVLGVTMNYVIAAHTLGLLVRGAIVAGSLCHSSQMCFGTALHQAYDIERNIADVPRIVVDTSCQAEFHRLFGWRPDAKGMSFPRNASLPDDLNEAMDDMIGCPLQTDEDDVVYFNWLWQDTMCILDGLQFAASNILYNKPYSAKIARKINWYVRFLNREGRARGSTPWQELGPVVVEQESEARGAPSATGGPSHQGD